MTDLTLVRKSPKTCDEGVTRKGEFQPCDKTAVAVRIGPDRGHAVPRLRLPRSRRNGPAGSDSRWSRRMTDDAPQTPASYWAEMIRADLKRRRAESETENEEQE